MPLRVKALFLIVLGNNIRRLNFSDCSSPFAAKMLAAALGVAGIAGRALGIAIHSLFRNDTATGRMRTFVGHGHIPLDLH